MRNWRDTIVSAKTTLRDTLANLSQSGAQIALVVSGDGQLQGVVTDGDIRKAILLGVELDTTTSGVMNTDPKTVLLGTSPREMQQLMRTNSLRHLPVIDDHGNAVGLVILDEITQNTRRANSVVIMAGGLGTRLHPLTEHIPKPMLTIGGKPILEIIIQQFANQGFSNIVLAVNYLSDSIRAHFNDGSRYGVQISYLHEEMRLGTAGALSLLPSNPDLPIVVMNGDLLTQLSFGSVLAFHEEHGADLTMVIREDSFQLPYGVVKVNGMKVTAIEEKPSQKLLVNAGIYVVNPSVIDLIPKNSYFDMPSLFAAALAANWLAVAFPLEEYWIDIGRVEELERAQREWVEFRS